MCIHHIHVWIEIFIFLSLQLEFYFFVGWILFLSWYRCPKTVAIVIDRCFDTVLLLISGQVINFPLFIAFINFLSVRLKQHSCRYWMSYVFVVSLVIIACDKCLNGFDIGMSHSPYDLFLFPFNISLESLWILISFLSKM